MDCSSPMVGTESGHPGVFQDDDGQAYLFFQGKASLNDTYYLSVCKVHFGKER